MFAACNATVHACAQALCNHRSCWHTHSPQHCDSAEVNASPSLSTDTAADHQLKWGLVEDALGLVDVEGKLEGQLPLSFGG